MNDTVSIQESLVNFGFARDKNEAQFMVEIGKVRVNGKTVTSKTILQTGDILGTLDSPYEIRVSIKDY